ncbi:DMT family transporter [Microbacterium sp. C5A9]|uniref:DMT family transporter n=1 Tax=Microbacterium sp. C5A9 TaxID=2736663 RepID=UPI001F520FFC|nr:DMT family transporter [Microbacterium sp. C5A9]MCI1019823.1 DMT family transporter [Microbacterium sp. C5A9]
MSTDSSVIVRTSAALSPRAGWGWGLLGVLGFSFTLPLTRIAVGGLSPLFIGSARAVVAAVLAALVLAATRQHPPTRAQWGRLAVVAAGVVAGFPLLTSFAMTTAPASHGAVVIGLLPAATAVLVVVRTRERPPVAFWAFAGTGAGAAVLFASMQNGGIGDLHWSDLLLFGAVLAAAIGYAEGGLLARELGSWQTVSWALVLAAPAMSILAIVAAVDAPPTATSVEWLAFAYLAVVSMFVAFFAWYRGLAIGPMAQVSQIQLVQPVLGIAWAALLLHESIGWSTLLGGLTVIVCAALAVGARSSSARAHRSAPSPRHPSEES